MQLGASDHDEKILVLVRLRPLNEKEISRNEVSDWECINDGTILYRNTLQERSVLPSAYSFDRVFRRDCSTKDVYEGGVRDIALSVVGGVNSTIFAYGQTSSGKTHTMTGITEYTVADIYDYIYRHKERAFVLKFSAIEIYNENVRDLLSTDVAPLRLLDDPEKGTTVERLTEETLRDWSHLKELLSICEAQRQIGETYLNETSSRSHQILRLTVESSAREFLGKDSSTTLAASVNFVDLAGSERASQSLSVGTRLKEGCHINRSLLTLGTVIRKLSKGRNGHINYRDSKLTRILQPSLGGNSRTAIICTLSPARSHVEQSRNTLLFASCAKEVSTNAQVNVVMSDKALVKHLQRELARLETELRSPVPSSSCDYAVLLRKKDHQIEKMEKEIRELIKQRDLAQSRVGDLLHMLQCDDSSRQSVVETCGDLIRPRVNDDVSTGVPSDNISELPIGGENELYKDVQCIETNSIAGATGRSPEKLAGEDEEAAALTSTATPTPYSCGSIFTPVHRQMTVPSPSYVKSPSVGLSSCRTISLARSRSCGANLMNGTFSPTSEKSQYNLKTPCEIENTLPRGCRVPPLIYNADIVFRQPGKRTSREGNNSAEENITSVGAFVAELTQMAEIQYDKLRAEERTRSETPFNNTDSSEASPNWSMEFERRRNAIIELWQACNVSLVHRTYFFLLFRGEPADSIYIEVELRKLSFLKEAFSRDNQDNEDLTLASSGRTLRREREMLCKLMVKRFSEGEREEMYGRWGIGLDTKRRRLQLVNMLWSDTKDMNRIEESAAIVAKLVRFSGQGHSLKEMSGLTFTPAYEHKKFYRFGNIFSMSPAY